MDWTAAIDKHREALKRVLAMLVAMAGLRGRVTFFPQEGARPQGLAPAEKSNLSPTLPRHLHRAVLRLLRPAESAVRRLVIVAARGLTPPPRKEAAPTPRKPKPTSAFLRKPGGTGILLPPGMLPPAARPRALALPLFDPLPHWNVRLRPAPKGRDSGVPRILAPGAGVPFPVAEWRPLSPDDPLDAGRLHRRLAALAAALDDLPRAARRFARLRACRDAARVQNLGAGVQSRKPRRLWPLRPGRPPGWRAPGSVRAHAVHETLDHLQGLAFWALERPDTS